jgi:HD superfamily phosphohydrolase
VVQKKGIYSIENYLVARRLMYWQVYLHKTAVAAEQMMINALLRAKQLASQGEELFASPALKYFLYNNVDRELFFGNPDSLRHYLALDDNDIWSALKVWCDHPDKILSELCRSFINRRIFRVEVSEEPFDAVYVESKIRDIAEHFGVTHDEALHFTSLLEVGKDMYNIDDDKIEILQSDGTTRDVTDTSDMLNLSTLSRKVKKHYFCYQRI